MLKVYLENVDEHLVSTLDCCLFVAILGDLILSPSQANDTYSGASGCHKNTVMVAASVSLQPTCT